MGYKQSKIKNKCVTCDNEFIKTNGKQFCCSKKCYTKYYYKNNQDKIKAYSENNKERLRELRKRYYEKNKAKINQYSKDYYNNNKEKYKKYESRQSPKMPNITKDQEMTIRKQIINEVYKKLIIQQNE